MTAIIWTPQEQGFPASVWLPGGPDEAPSGCQLVARTPIETDGYIFVDNFTGADGILLPAHAPDLPDSALWQQTSGDVENYLALLDGSLVAPTPQADNLSVYAFPLSRDLYTDIGVTGHVGIFDITSPAYAEFYVSLFDTGGLAGTLKAMVTVPGEDGTAIISFAIDILGAATYYSDEFPIAYCGWAEFDMFVESTGGGNLSYSVTVDGTQVNHNTNSGSFIMTDVGDLNIYAAIRNVLPNTIRLADMEIFASSPG